MAQGHIKEFDTESERKEWLDKMCFKTYKSSIIDVCIFEEDDKFCVEYLSRGNYFPCDNFGMRGAYNREGHNQIKTIYHDNN